MNELLYKVVIAGLVGFIFNIVLCPVIIPYLHKMKFGQTVRDDGPKEHLKKTGTPTMGGIMIIISFFFSAILFSTQNREGLLVIFVTVAFGVIGFLDDYIKVIKKRSLGLRAYQKFFLQMIVTGLLAYYLMQDQSYREIYIPFTNGLTFDLGMTYPVFVFIVVLGTVNGTNFTDGLDGLATGVTSLVTVFFLFCCLSMDKQMSPVVSGALGSLLGFLLFNAHPAKIMMGDTGSLALGGFISSVALFLKMPLFIVIVGVIYLAEVLSVALQVLYFKATKGKRLFKMAPIHHHFELLGWEEPKVVATFYVVTAIACLVGFLASRGILMNI